jgi:DNA-binding transcriptional LysR family regulator
MRQPTISKVLARLRTQFQDPLFVRDGQSMRPTPRAMELAAPLMLGCGRIAGTIALQV